MSIRRANYVSPGFGSKASKVTGQEWRSWNQASHLISG
jgi:hypothetical protein